MKLSQPSHYVLLHNSYSLVKRSLVTFFLELHVLLLAILLRELFAL